MYLHDAQLGREGVGWLVGWLVRGKGNWGWMGGEGKGNKIIIACV